MPDTSLEKLLDYEGNTEDALAAVLRAAGISQVLTPRTTITEETQVETPRATVICALTGSDEQLIILDNGQEFESHKDIAVSLVVVARRNDPAQSLSELRGRIRKLLLTQDTALSYPWYEYVFIRETGAAQEVDPDNDEVRASLTFEVRLAVLPAGFP